MTNQEIKKCVSLESVLANMYGIEINGVSDCPIHGGDKCFSIRGEYFKCFSCGASGDIFELVQLLSKVDFTEAKKRICEHFNLSPSRATKAQVEAIKAQKEEKKILRKLRQYQQDRIRQVLRVIRTAEGDSFLERHLENLLGRFEQRKQFYVAHDIHAHLISLLERYKEKADCSPKL